MKKITFLFLFLFLIFLLVPELAKAGCCAYQGQCSNPSSVFCYPNPGCPPSAPVGPCDCSYCSSPSICNTCVPSCCGTYYTLTVSKSGTGSGTVTGDGVYCGTVCSKAYSSGTSVTLTATAASGSTFAGWSGACTGTGGCTVSMTQNRSVTATFTAGGGVTPPGVGVTCPGTTCPSGTLCIQNPLCAETFEQLIDAIIDFIFKIAVVLAPLMILIGGILFVTSGGNENRVKQAKDLITWTVVGFAIVLVAKGITSLIEQLLGVR